MKREYYLDPGKQLYAFYIPVTTLLGAGIYLCNRPGSPIGWTIIVTAGLFTFLMALSLCKPRPMLVVSEEGLRLNTLLFPWEEILEIELGPKKKLLIRYSENFRKPYAKMPNPYSFPLAMFRESPESIYAYVTDRLETFRVF